MTIAILGAGGQLGRELTAQLGSEAAPFLSAQLDLTRPETFAALRARQPSIVINCAAYNFVDRAETEPEHAFAVNALGIRTLASCCADLGCTLLHVSTDHVFGFAAARQEPYREDDVPGPVSVYGASKLAGEHFARACPRHFVVRTCGLYGSPGSGGKGTNFVQAILRRAREGLPLRVVSDQVCTPTSTALLARALIALLRTQAYGLYHITGAGACSWFEFATAALAQAGLAADITPVTSAEYGAAARRPRYSVLDGTRFDRLGLLPRPAWRDDLTAYLGSEAASGQA